MNLARRISELKSEEQNQTVATAALIDEYLPRFLEVLKEYVRMADAYITPQMYQRAMGSTKDRPWRSAQTLYKEVYGWPIEVNDDCPCRTDDLDNAGQTCERLWIATADGTLLLMEGIYNRRGVSDYADEYWLASALPDRCGGWELIAPHLGERLAVFATRRHVVTHWGHGRAWSEDLGDERVNMQAVLNSYEDCLARHLAAGGQNVSHQREYLGKRATALPQFRWPV